MKALKIWERFKSWSGKKKILSVSLAVVFVAGVTVALILIFSGGENIIRKQKVVVVANSEASENNVSSDSPVENDEIEDTSSTPSYINEAVEETGDDDETEDIGTDRFIPVTTGSSKNLSEQDTVFKADTAAWNGPKDYRIVYPEGNENALEYAMLLKNYYLKNGNFDLEIVDDGKKTAAKEILVGNTNRKKIVLSENEYSVSLDGSNLIFSGGHDVMLKKAVQIFTRLTRKNGEANIFKKTSDFTSTALSGYKYVWGDEFDGTSLDSERWGLGTGIQATEEMVLSDTENNIRVENGFLKLFATRYWDPKTKGAEFAAPWSVTTGNTMSFKHGYLEMRARIPYVRGAWPSFWASSNRALGPKTAFDYTIEVDFFEIFSSTDTVVSNIHKWYFNGAHTQWASNEEKYIFSSPDNLVNEYHTYGFEWTAEKMTMFVDGNAFYTYDLSNNFDDGESGMGGYDTQLMIILNNHLFTDSSLYKPYSGCEIYINDLPTEYDIDYIRLYQKSDGVSKLHTK